MIYKRGFIVFMTSSPGFVGFVWDDMRTLLVLGGSGPLI